MTTGSAASLALPGPAAPLPAFRSFRNGGRRPAAFAVDTASAPQRLFPRTAMADDSPRGRILVVADRAPLALEVQRILREAGYRIVGPAATSGEAARLIERRPIDGAVVDLQLAGGAAAVADALAQAGVPFVWLTVGAGEGTSAAPPSAHAAPMVAKPVNSPDLIEALERALSRGRRSGAGGFYPVPPPQTVWPRVFPQL